MQFNQKEPLLRMDYERMMEEVIGNLSSIINFCWTFLFIGSFVFLLSLCGVLTGIPEQDFIRYGLLVGLPIWLIVLLTPIRRVLIRLKSTSEIKHIYDKLFSQKQDTLDAE